MNNKSIEIKVTSVEINANKDFDFDTVLYDLDNQIELLSSQADTWDYLVAVASGILCGMLDIMWVGDFSLENGRAFANDKIDSFVTKAANLLGYKGDDLQSAVKFLEEQFPIPSDGNTPDFGGGLQHHLRDLGQKKKAFSKLIEISAKSHFTRFVSIIIILF